MPVVLLLLACLAPPSPPDEREGLTDLFLVETTRCFAAAVDTLAAGRPLSPDDRRAVRDSLPPDEPRRGRLEQDLATVSALPAGDAAGLRRIVAAPTRLLAGRGGEPAAALDEHPLDTDLAALATRHGALLSRWLGRACLSLGPLHDWRLAIDQAQLAVLLADASGDAFDRGLARLCRASCATRNGLRRGDWAELVLADVARIQELLPAARHAARLLEVGVPPERGPLEDLRLLGTLVDDSATDLPTRLAAAGQRLELLIRLSDWDRAEDAARALQLQLSGAAPGPSLVVPWRALGVFHRQRVPLPGETTDDRLDRSIEAFEQALAACPTPVDEALLHEWLISAYASRGRLHEARDALAASLDVLRSGPDQLALRRLLAHGAWLELLDGHPDRALELLDEQQPLLPADDLDGLSDHHRVRARVCQARADLTGVLASLLALLVIEDREIAATPPELADFPAAESVETHGFLVETLASLADTGVPAARLLPLAIAVVEHGRARLLRRALVSGPSQLAGPDVLSAEDLGRAHLTPLPEGVAELRWFLGRRLAREELDTYVLLARRGDQVVLRSLGLASEIDARIDAFLQRWMAPTALALPASAYVAEVEPLSQLLLGPARDWADDERIRHLLVMPDGHLERLPLGALLSGPVSAPPAGFGELPYLIRGASLACVPSLAILAALPEPNGSGRALALLGTGRADALHFARDELEGLAASHPGSLLLTDDDASHDQLRIALTAGPFGWLHLASHARPAADQRAAASLDLADGTSLSVGDVAALPDLAGARVVLSACGTATGTFLRGEGVMGLWRAFLLSGASCVVSTLTEVDDRSTAVWMDAFHRHAAEGAPLAEAARRATLDWLDGRQRPRFPRGATHDPNHPFLWAPFVCLGRDGGPIPGGG